MGIEWHDVIEIASPVTLVFIAGRMSERLKTFERDITDMKAIATQWSGTNVKISALEDTTGKLLSYHRELAAKVAETRGEIHGERNGGG